MSQSSIQKKLYNAYGKIANVIGTDFDIYRPAELNNPIVDSNFMTTQKVSFSKDEKYKKPASEGLSIWNCWTNGNLEALFDIQQGDMLYSQEKGTTYYIASAEPLLPILAIRAPNRISVSNSSTYGDSGTGYGPTATVEASSVPCYIMQPSSSDQSAGYVPASNYAVDGIPNFVMYVADPADQIDIRDSITDENGIKSRVLAIYKSDYGKKIVTKAVK